MVGQCLKSEVRYRGKQPQKAINKTRYNNVSKPYFHGESTKVTACLRHYDTLT